MTMTPTEIIVIYYFASAFVQALPSPNGNVLYSFAYRFLSLIVADFKSYSSPTR